MPETGEGEDRQGELLFQLSSWDRRRILAALLKEDLRLTETAKRLGMTPTETFRQLQKLTEAGLLRKLPDTRYGLTAYARLAMDSTSSTGFIARYREYFTDHDATELPVEFRGRLGELSGGALFTESVASLNKVTEMLRNARERIDIMVAERFGVHGEIMTEKQAEGLKFRALIQETMIPEARTLMHGAKLVPEMRVIPKVRAIIIMTEKEAAITLPRVDGKFDQVGFVGNDSAFLRWASDFYRDQWEKAKPWYP